MRAAVLLLSIGAIACDTKGEDGVAAMERWSRAICGCQDLACAQEHTLAMKKELDRIESGSRGKVRDSHVKRLVELGDGIAACIADLEAAEAARTWPPDAARRAEDATRVMAEHVERICACKTSACVTQERTAWARAMKPYSEGPASLATHPAFLEAAATASRDLERCKPPT